MVYVEELSFSYRRDHPIFLNFSWHIGKGEIWSIIAPSGYGKTTLLYLLAGLYLPASGRISINGKPLKGTRISTGLILQDYGLLPWATAHDNISLGMKIRHFNNKEVESVTNRWLEKLDIAAMAKHYPSELSGGQRQRVAIARTLALEPDLLLMDEPFGSLDMLTRENLQNLIIKLRRDMPSMSIVVVTHNIEEAVFLGEKILVFHHLPVAVPELLVNHNSGYLDYRNSPGFIEKCGELRELINNGASADGRLERLFSGEVK